MELEFLGTGAGVPSKQRNVTSIALKLLDERNEVWLFDCGEGTQHQILHTTVRPRKIKKIFITHLHGDHIFGLPGFLSSRSFQSGDALDIYGPKGIQLFIETSLKVSGACLTYPVTYHEITESGVVFQDNQYTVSCLPLDHRVVSYGYRIEEADFPGELLIEKLKAEKIPAGPIYGKIKNKEQVVLEDGRIIDGKNYVGNTKSGRIITILGDTRKCDNSIILAKNADVLVHEATFEKADYKMAKAYYHSTSQQAAEVAKTAQVNKLLITHISARYTGKACDQLLKEARNIFKNTRIVKDFDRYDVSVPHDIEKK